MRDLFIFCVLFTTFYSQSQEKENRNAIYQPCADSENPEDCLYQVLQKKVIQNYDDFSLNLIDEAHQKDTITVNFSLAVQTDGQLDLLNSGIVSCDEYIDSLNKNILLGLSKFKVFEDAAGNKLSDLISKNIYFKFKRENGLELVPLPFNKNYVSENIGFAVIDEVPVFEGCKGSENKKLCFQQKMQEHIRNNFRYPRKAQKKKITGRVINFFIVDKDGSISKIRTFGAHELLMQESKRIISLIPKMKPGKQRGKEVRVPFAIPITFALR